MRERGGTANYHGSPSAYTEITRYELAREDPRESSQFRPNCLFGTGRGLSGRSRLYSPSRGPHNKINTLHNYIAHKTSSLLLLLSLYGPVSMQTHIHTVTLSRAHVPSFSFPLCYTPVRSLLIIFFTLSFLQF